MQAVIGKKKYSCKIKITAKTTNSGTSRVSKVPVASEAPKTTTTPTGTNTPIATATPTDVPGGAATIKYDGTNSDEIKNIEGEFSVVIQDGVTTIEEWVFSGCSGLTSVEIPSSVTTIGERVFSSCWSLESITWKDNVYTSYDEFEAAFYNSDN